MSTSALKWTALVLMVLDHLGEFSPDRFRCGFVIWAECQHRCFCSALQLECVKPEVGQDISRGCGSVRR